MLLASSLAQAQCTKDIDCKGDRVCDAGKCTSPAPAAVTAGGATPDGATPNATGTATPAAGPEAGVALAGPSSPTSLPGPALSPVPAGATTSLGADEPALRRRSRAALVSGIVMVSVGPIALLGALVAKNSQDKCDKALETDYPTHVLPTSERYRVDECNAYSAPVYMFSIGGAVLIAAGVPLIIYGGKNVPTQPKTGSLRVLPWAGPDSGGLKLRLEL